MDKPKETKKNRDSRFSGAFKDLIILGVITAIVLVLSYFFDVFIFLVKLFQKRPYLITYIDEIITGLLTLSIGFAIFSWRRWLELKKETAKRLRLHEELVKVYQTKAETERIICKQLHWEIEEYKKIERDILSHRAKKPEAE